MKFTLNGIVHIIFAFILYGYGYAQKPDLMFDHLTVEDGLSSNKVYSILQDSQGFMWFGTGEGLNRYDGYRFKSYQHNPADASTISDNYIWFECLAEDQNGMIWVGTRTAGLNRFDRVSETFDRFQHDPYDSLSLSSDNNITVFIDHTGRLWVGTDSGLNRFDPSSETFERFQHTPGDSASPGHNNIWEIHETGQGKEATLWIATHGGLARFDHRTEQFSHIQLNGLDPNGERTGPITDLYGDQRGTLWLGSAFGLVRLNLQTMKPRYYRHDPENSNSLNFPVITDIWQDPGTQGRRLWITTRNGLNRLDTETDSFSHYAYDLAKPDGLNTHSVVALHEDKNQRLWIGSHSGGINKLNPPVPQFNFVKHNPDNANSLSGYQVRAICEDDQQALWIGTERGLTQWDRSTGLFVKFTFDAEENGVYGVNVISGITENGGELWLGTRGGGLVAFDPQTEAFGQYRHDPDDPHSLASDEIGRIFFDRFGTLWLGTTENVVSRLLPEDRHDGRFTHVELPRKNRGLKDQKGFAFLADSYGDVWLGSQLTGLYRFDRETEQFIAYLHAPGNPNGLNSNAIKGIAETRSARDTILWVGTIHGLHRFDRRFNKFRHIKNNQPRGSEHIFTMSVDGHNNIWIQNERGISTFDPDRETFLNYAGSRGLPADLPNDDGYYRNSRGEMFFGGMGGMIYFHPDSMVNNPYIPPVVITDIKILNKSTRLDSSITMKNTLNLSYQQNFFSFSFAALDYTHPERNQYAYKLEGLDQAWINNGNQGFANYTAVPPGNYVFRVRGANNDGVWNEDGASLVINISPPWWKTVLARLLFGLIILGILYGIRKYEVNRQRLKHALEIEHLEAQQLQEMDRLKSRFFANISHEFRTPLTLILGPLEQLIADKTDNQQHTTFLRMRRNARRLQRLINQLLDLSKLEAGKMILHAEPMDIVQFTRFIVMAFESLAELRKITLTLNVPERPAIVSLDRDKYEKIIANLVSNALKFTPPKGSVEIAIKYNPHPPNPVYGKNDEISPSNHGGLKWVEIIVTDSGAGIAAEQLPHIFDRFYQPDNSHTRKHEGTGIGLALTRELVELHGGAIRVVSKIDHGTTFTVMLPQGSAHLQPENIVEQQAKNGEEEVLEEYVSEYSVIENIVEMQQSAPHSSRTTILIVEDNPDMRGYMRGHLENQYRIIEADNGKRGIRQAQQHSPDLIISDVMMPEMDGFELCRNLKSNEHTSHIPIVLLTARASTESKVEGLETGADDYLVKPFDARELQVRVKNLIDQRQKLRERFSREVIVQPKDITVTSIDEQLLQQAISIVEENIANSDFHIDQFCKAMGMSRSTLNRKLRALTGYSSNGFIRILRLKRASQLLERKSATIVEIAYAVGFSNPSYFAECFRKQFGASPSEYTAG